MPAFELQKGRFSSRIPMLARASGTANKATIRDTSASQECQDYGTFLTAYRFTGQREEAMPRLYDYGATSQPGMDNP